MSTNDIELTFIRCPSCKSLMPSTAVICGMCGFELDAKDDSHKKNGNENIGKENKRTRLRQRTYSGSINELLESTKEEKSREPSVSLFGEEKNDPIDKVDKSEESEISSHFDDINIESARNQENEDKTEDLRPNSGTRKLRFANDPPKSSESTNKEEEEREVGFAEDTSKNQESDLDNTTIDRPKKRRRRKRKKQRLAQIESPQSSAEPESKDIINIKDENKQESSDIKKTQNKDIEDIDYNNKNDLKDDSSLQNSESNSEEQEKATKQSVVNIDPSISKVTSVGEKNMNEQTKESVLVGWFVNYSTNKTGVSFEIRIGRQFIGRQSLRGDDLIIQDSAVSTPHCLLQVDNQDSVLLQDLMSEQGTYIKKKGANDFEQVDSTIKLEHGDKIKLGSYELVVCLVPN